MSITQEIVELKKQIKDNIAVHDELVCNFCDTLIQKAHIVDDKESFAFAYVWKADHFFYVTPDRNQMYEYLVKALSYIDQKKPSELLEKLYTLCNLFYESISDEKSSLNYCLRALEVAESLNLKQRISANYGSIGEFFIKYGYYKETLNYLTKSLQILDENNEENHRLIRMILVSLSQVYIELNELGSAKKMIDKLYTLKLEEKDIKIFIDKCSVAYYAKLKDVEKTVYYADELLADGAFHYTNRLFAIEFITTIFKSMLQIKQKEYASKMLDLLNQLVEETEYERQLELIKCNIQFDKIFQPDQLIKHYKAYYQIYKEATNLSRQLKIEGLNAKIKLHEKKIEQNEIKEKMISMENVANIDELTRVYNRRYLNIKQSAIIADKASKSLGYIIVDVDYFKEYNDYYGHVLGDKVLKSVAQCLQTNTDKNMVVCRYGGDEFTCIFWNLNSEDVQAYIEKVRTSLNEKNIAHQYSLCSDRVTLSIGFGIQPLPIPSNTNQFTFFEKVDKALYEAKKKGRNTVSEMEYDV